MSGDQLGVGGTVYMTQNISTMPKQFKIELDDENSVYATSMTSVRSRSRTHSRSNSKSRSRSVSAHRNEHELRVANYSTTSSDPGYLSNKSKP